MNTSIDTAVAQAFSGQKTDGQNRPKYATVKNPTIEAIIGEHFRFSAPEQAQSRLDALRETFIVSKLPAEIDASPLELKLWIRGFGLTAESREGGYIGNYVKLEVKPLEKGKWTLSATLLNIDKKYHPQRRQTQKRHPNWGHPIMRDIQRARVHKTIESAQNEMIRLHETFPEVSIPLTNKMYIMVYQKPATEAEPPIQKWVLEIKALDSGGFKIEASLNTYQADIRQKVAATHTQTATPTPKNEAIGRFTSQVLLKKSKKKGAPAPKTANATPKDEN